MGDPCGARHVLQAQPRRPIPLHLGLGGIQDQGAGIIGPPANTFFLQSQRLNSLLTILYIVGKIRSCSQENRTMLAQATIDTRLRPFEAVRAVRHLMANPEDTSQVFTIFRALRGKSGIKAFNRFAGSATGARVLRERRQLLTTLSDRARLQELPEESFGHRYFEFMETENLTADGLVQASQSWENDPVPAEMELFRARMRDAHDLTHVLTGYGRDGLGEACLLAFMYAHNRNRGALLILLMSLRRMPRLARRAVAEAWRNGKKARWLQDQDYEALVSRPLDDVRRELNIADPSLYRAVMA
jgi:ubiquinone biosynthesis protein COQ4